MVIHKWQLYGTTFKESLYLDYFDSLLLLDDFGPLAPNLTLPYNSCSSQLKEKRSWAIGGGLGVGSESFLSLISANNIERCGPGFPASPL